MQKNQITLRGTLHTGAGIANQDAVQVFEAGGFTGAVLCDGVSLKSDRTYSKSQIASAVCTQAAARYMKEHLKRRFSEDQLLDCLKGAFCRAQRTLEVRLAAENIALQDCQTTMILFVLRNGILYAGIAGDGGILFRDVQGETGSMVTRWKTDSGVYPISACSKWRFFTAGDSLHPVRQVLAATDGIFDLLIAPHGEKILVSWNLLDLLFGFSKLTESRRKRAFEKLIRSLPTQDDKSAVLISDGALPLQTGSLADREDKG